ncbi:helicase-associated domain-containing protein [Isoptericola sp. b441]|uniref:Helicase-associated domain-containing protein n=1 Tax=Actinotalea lenta TaxID=3064654 RepID=A0ABT9DCL4_9CELL|nr:helicase-associated domain-containing protein [Isoptericola sp. b441]MDO8106662.1 helicase-associated domain-containing protein [Isoptericola sp. b441]
MATFTEHLRALGVDGLAALLDRRRDLAAPPPASVRALAARAGTRASLDRALARIDTGTLAGVEAVVALPPPVRPADVSHAVGAHADVWLGVAEDWGLVWQDDDGLHAAPGLSDLLGPHPAGLGPPLAETLARRSTEALATLAAEVGCTPTELAERLADTATVEGLLAEAPIGARAVLDALTWGPPVGRTPRPGTPGAGAVGWLLRTGLLAVGDPQHVVLPAEVALALRGGRTRREPPTPPAPTVVEVDSRTVDADAAGRALETVRLVGELLELWGRAPAAVLRSGGLGARELKRVAAALEVDAGTAALLVEVAGAARLVAEDGEESPSFCPTTVADDWAGDDAAHRWVELVRAWLTAERAPWLVGSRDEAGSLRGALDSAHRRPWVPRLRAAVLGALADAGGRVDAADLHTVLAWRTPRSAPTEHAVQAVLDEAAVLGVTGAGALGGPARQLLAGWVPPDGTEPTFTPTAVLGAAAALSQTLPAPVDEVLLGGDLTGVVPGRPSDALEALLTDVAQVESRGAGLTVRFTEESLRGALDRRSAPEILDALASHARGEVPQPLRYLVTDAARRHGQVRVGSGAAYLRGDPAALAGIEQTPALRALGLRVLAPGVLISPTEPAALLEALRAAGLPAAAEDAAGTVLHARPTRHRVRHTPMPVPDPEVARRRLLRVAGDLVADTGGPAAAPVPPADGTPEPSEALAVLRAAVGAGTEVWLEVASPGGTTRRRVRPLLVEGGRVRVLDQQRAAELTVAVHRIAGAQPVDGPAGVRVDRSADGPVEDGEAWTDH